MLTSKPIAAACNQGIAAAAGDTVLLLNPDTVLGENVLQKTSRFLRETPEAGIVGCRLLNEAGLAVKSSRTFPTLWSYLRENLGLRSSLGSVLPPAKRASAAAARVDLVMGAFFMVKRAVFDQVGPLDERFFMYAEERDFCLRAKSAGWSVYLLTDISSLHIGGRSTRQAAAPMYVQRLRSTLALHRKHNSATYVGLLRIILMLGSGGRALLWTLLSLITRREAARQKRESYAAGTRWLWVGDP